MPGLQKAGRFDIADIVRAHRAALESSYTLSSKQRRVLSDIESCRTAALGGHIDRCLQCGHERPAYNSCRNRHCPKCQALAQEKWIAAQEARTLDVQHFHVVFTLPKELRSLARFAARVVYDALFYAASRTLLEFGESRRAPRSARRSSFTPGHATLDSIPMSTPSSRAAGSHSTVCVGSLLRARSSSRCTPWRACFAAR